MKKLTLLGISLLITGCAKNSKPVPPFSFGTIDGREAHYAMEHPDGSTWDYSLDEPIGSVYLRMNSEITSSLNVKHHRPLAKDGTASWTVIVNDKTFFIVLVPGKPGDKNNIQQRNRSHCTIQIF